MLSVQMLNSTRNTFTLIAYFSQSTPIAYTHTRVFEVIKSELEQLSISIPGVGRPV